MGKRRDSKPDESAGADETPKRASSESVSGDSPNPAASELGEDQALALLKRSDVTAADLALLGRSLGSIRSRKVLLALAMHQRTPRHVTIPILRQLFTFDLLQVALAPAVAADVKHAAEEQILNRLEALSLGERISLARRASGRVAAALLLDAEARVISTALDNSRLVEALVVTALMKGRAPESLFALASANAKWSLRREVQIALLRSEKLPLERAVKLAGNFTAELLREMVPAARREVLIEHAGPPSSEHRESEVQESEDRQFDDQESGDEI